MIDVDPDLVAAWGRSGPRRLRLEVDDPVGAWGPLCDALDGDPAAAAARSDPVVAPGGLVFHAEAEAIHDEADADPGEGLRRTEAWVRALAASGVTHGRFTVNRYPAEREAELARQVGRTSWIVAWMVPRMIAGVDFGYRSMRGWRVRRFPRSRLDRLAAHVGARDAPVVVASSGGGFEVLGHDLASYARQWLEHGVVTTSVLGPLPRPSPVLVTTARRGAEMVGVGQAAEGLADDPERAQAVLDGLTDLVLELAGDLAYAVVGVHETGAGAVRGTPFRETTPATARALDTGLSLGVLDQWVLDAAPVQLLTPHHRVTRREGIDEAPVKGTDLRLVRVGAPADWFSGPARRAQIRNRGRDALAACLPPHRTPLPPPRL